MGIITSCHIPEGQFLWQGQITITVQAHSFFIVHQDYPSLDGQYAVFGYVTEGIEVVDAVCTDAQPVDGNGSIAPDAQPVITSITIRDEE